MRDKFLEACKGLGLEMEFQNCTVSIECHCVAVVIRPSLLISLSLSSPLFLSSFCAYHKCNSLMVWLNFQESPDRYVKIHATHDILLKGAEEMLLRMPIKVAYYTC